jgi:RNA polymerase sigma-54 factor
MMKPSLQLRIGQQLAMTPQLQQAIRLLQLPTVELQAQVLQALESNVMLESDEDFEATWSLDAMPAEARAAPDESGAEPEGEPADVREEAEPVVEIGDDWTEPSAAESEAPWSGSGGSGSGELELPDESGRTLRDHLLWQLELARLPPAALAIAQAVVDAINDDGYLTESLETIAEAASAGGPADLQAVERVLEVVQQLDPAGVGARSVGECIELQLAQLDPATPGLAAARTLAHRHLELVAGRELAALQREMHVSGDELDVALALVRSCHPRPGAAFQSPRTEYVVPDVYARRTPQGWVVELNPSALPRVRLNEGYAGMITRAPDHAVLRTQLQEARWLLRSLEIRNETMLKVARTIVDRQQAFLDRGEESMQPMVLKDVAEAVEMHESTISRVTTGKYLHTPRGVFEFRFFFSSQVAGGEGAGVSSTAIRAKIRKLVAQEAPGRPLSDQQLVELLAADGVQVARRTVAKYRESLGIAPSSARRQAAR